MELSFTLKGDMMKVFFVGLILFSSFVFAKPGPDNHYSINVKFKE